MRRRLAGLAAVVLVGSGGVAAAQQLRPAATASVPVTQVSLPATGLAAVPVCPGPQTLIAPAGGTPIAPGGPVAVAAAVQGAAGSTSPGARLGGQVLRAGDAPGFGFLTLTRTAAGPVLLQPSRSTVPPPMSAVQLGLARQGDQRGLAGMVCSTATTRTWLVGGGTQAGRRGHLVLVNPAATPAEVDVTVHGPQGALEAPAGTGVVVAPNGVLALRVDALAPELDAVAVLVQARSGRVSASLFDSHVRGLTPTGADVVTGAAPPAERQVVPGIVVAPPAGLALPGTATAPGAVAVRIVNPGTTEAVARVSLVGTSGPLVLPDAVLTLGPGQVSDVPITTAAPGTYTAVVEADAPVVAGAFVGRTVAGGQLAGTPAGVGKQVPASEFGWAASVEPLSGTTLVALPQLTESGRRTSIGAALTVAAPTGGGSLDVAELDAAGQEVLGATVEVTAGSNAVRPLSDRAVAVRLRSRAGSSPLVAAVLLQAQDAAGPLVSVLPVRPGPAGSGTRRHVVADVRVGLRG